MNVGETSVQGEEKEIPGKTSLSASGLLSVSTSQQAFYTYTIAKTDQQVHTYEKFALSCRTCYY